VQGINAELGIGISEDVIVDSLSERAEKEIVCGGVIEKNIIGHCAPFISKLCRNFNLMEKVIGFFITWNFLYQCIFLLDYLLPCRLLVLSHLLS